MVPRKNHFPAVMRSTAALSAAATAGLAWYHTLHPQGWVLALAITCGTVCYHFTMRLLAGAVVPLFAGSFHPDQRWFRQHSWEPRLYAALKIKNLKRGIPTYDPKQFDLTVTPLPQVVRNMCCAEVVHEVIIVFSFLPLAFAIPFGEFPVFLITSLLAAGFDSIFVIAQRFNRPRLVRILKKKEANAP